jgi:2-polyprenyl-6-methoxyphenol hydroxylase-like FAD-dependent oxidoreductase
LTLGIELARRQIPFRLIDRKVERALSSRALGTQPRTIEVFRLMGIPESALQPAVRPRAFRFMEGRRRLAEIEFATSAIVMNEADTERVLQERLESYGGRVEWGTALESFRLEGDRVIASLAGPNGVKTVGARFLVGCDGANSTVRRDAGIGFTGATYAERFLLADLELDWEMSHDEATIWFGDEAGLAAAIPIPGERRWRLIVALPVAESDLPVRETEGEIAARAVEELRRRAEIPLRVVGDPLWASSFRIHRKLADRYRAGPVFLAGDAAHIHSPIGGQGMNTGIQDAFNLGWKLALAVNDQAAPGLLDSYGRERRPVAEVVLRGTNAAARLLAGANPVSRVLREWVLPVVTDLPPVRRQLFAAISELNVGYPDSPLSVAAPAPTRRALPTRERGLRPGQRVPDATLLDGRSGESLSLFDLISEGWVLLLFPGDRDGAETSRALEEVARQVRAMVGDAVRPYFVPGRIPPANTEATVVIDPVGEVARVFGVGDGLVALMRPDGYLGFRGRPDQVGEVASYLARVFAMRMPGLEGAPSLPRPAQ